MSLRKQQFNINLSGGLDKKTSDMLVIPSKLSAAQDVELEDTNTLRVRNGTDELVIPTGTKYTTPVRMFDVNGKPTIEFYDGTTITAGNITSPAADLGRPINTNINFPSVFPRTGAQTCTLQQLTRQRDSGNELTENYDIAEGDSTGAETFDKYAIAWEEYGTSGGIHIRFEVRSSATHAVEFYQDFIADGGVVSAYMRPRVIYDVPRRRFSLFFAKVLVAAPNDISIYGCTYDIGSGQTALVGPNLIITKVGTVPVSGGNFPLFDLAFNAINGFYSFCVRTSNAAGTISMGLLSPTHVALIPFTSAAPTLYPSSLTASADIVSAGNVNRGFAIYGGITGGLYGFYLPQNTGVQSASILIFGTAEPSLLIGRIAVIKFSLNESLIIACDNFNTTTDSYARTLVVSCDYNYTSVLLSPITTNCFILGRIITCRARLCILVGFMSTKFQSVALLLDLTEVVGRNLRAVGFEVAAEPLFWARFDWGEVHRFDRGPSGEVGRASRVPGCSPNFVTYLGLSENTRFAGVYENTGTRIKSARLGLSDHLGDVEFSGVKMLAGALPLIVSGSHIVEEGFHWNPEVLGSVVSGQTVLTPQTTGTGILDLPAVGTYTMAFTETWEDAAGNWYESGYSSICTVTTTVGNLAIKPTIVRPPSLKRRTGASVRDGLTVYRSLPATTGDNTLYLANGRNYPATPLPVSDADLPFGEVLYTEGGVLPNTPAPACRHITQFQKRLVLSGCGDGSRVYWSKELDAGFAAEFASDNTLFQQQIPRAAGRVVGTQEMNGKLVVVGEEQIGIVYGNGPDNKGIQGGYSQFETVVEDVGTTWTSVKSLRLAAEGLWFQTKYGLRLFSGQSLARDAAGKFIGSEVDSLVGASRMVALSGGLTQQTRFIGASKCVVWDQHWGQFTEFSNHDSIDACLSASTYYLIKNSNRLFRRKSYEDGVDTVSVLPLTGYIETAWISLAQIQGFQRVYKILLLLETSGSPDVVVNVAYDGNNTFTLAAAIATTQLGPIVQYEIQLVQQKCQSIKIAVAINDSGFQTRHRLTNIALSVGLKKGPWPSSQVIVGGP